jgi:DNA-binding protein YbaB
MTHARCPRSAVGGMVTASRYASIAGAIRRLAPDEIEVLKELRLSALADALSAFASTYEQAAALATTIGGSS